MKMARKGKKAKVVFSHRSDANLQLDTDSPIEITSAEKLPESHFQCEDPCTYWYPNSQKCSLGKTRQPGDRCLAYMLKIVPKKKLFRD